LGWFRELYGKDKPAKNSGNTYNQQLNRSKLVKLVMQLLSNKERRRIELNQSGRKAKTPATTGTLLLSLDLIAHEHAPPLPDT
jgi:hypothetical protein